jgi:hypothetical protein
MNFNPGCSENKKMIGLTMIGRLYENKLLGCLY